MPMRGRTGNSFSPSATSCCGHPTLEAAYLALVRSGSIALPPLFVNQLVHVILRNALDGCDDPFVLRAAELFFRPQRIMLHEQSLLLG